MILKVLPKDNFVIMTNEIAQNDSLSYAARGLLLKLMSLPPKWDFSQNRMIIKGARIDKVRKLFKELQRARHICHWKEVDEKAQFTGKRGWAASSVPLTKKQFIKRIIKMPNPDGSSLKNIKINPA